MALNYHDAIIANKRKTGIIFFLFFLIIGFIGGVSGMLFGVYGGTYGWPQFLTGVILALLAAGIYLLVFLSQGDKMILAATGATEASREQYPYLYHTTEALALASGLGGVTPKCYVIDSDSINAYATGFKPEKSYIAVTTGLLKRLNREEVEGVLAHEMAHIKNRDIRIMLLAAGLVGVIVLLADILFRMFIFAPSHGGGKKEGRLMLLVFAFWFVLLLLSPFIGKAIQMSISREREYLADVTGAKLTRNPEGLASALEKIRKDTKRMEGVNRATAHLFISSPLKKQGKGSARFSRLFSTHPPISSRISRLRGKR